MPTTTVEKELALLEKRYWQALKDGDLGTVMSLTDFPVILTGAQGMGRVDEQMFSAMMKKAQYNIEGFELREPIEVRMLLDDVAVVAYKVHEDLTVEGTPLTLEATDSSTWVRRGGKWLCAHHTESILGDPFGRDRVSEVH